MFSIPGLYPCTNQTMMMHRIGHIVIDWARILGFMSLPVLATPLLASANDASNYIGYFKTNWVYSISSSSNDRYLPVSATSNSVAIIDGENQLRFVDRDNGQTRWVRTIPEGTNAIPVLCHDHVLVASRTRHVLEAYHAQDGSFSWSILSGVAPSAGFCANLVPFGDLLCSVATNGTVTAFSAETGEVVWKCWLDAIPDVKPLYANASLFIPTQSRELVSVDARTGGIRWRKQVDSMILCSLAHDTQAVYCLTCGHGSTSTLYKIDMATGKSLWATVTPRAFLTGPFVIGDRILIVGDVLAGSKACMVSLSAETGCITQERLCPRVATSGMLDGKSFWCTTGLNELYVYDSDSLCPALILESLPTPLRVLSPTPYPLFVIGNQLISGNVDGGRLLRLKHLGFIFRGVTPTSTVSVLILITGLLLVTYVTLRGRATIPPTHETTGLVFGWLVLACVTCCMALMSAYVVSKVVMDNGCSILRITTIVALMLLPVCALGFWISTVASSRLLRRYFCSGFIANDPAIAEVFTSLTKVMRISPRTDLITSERCGISPYVCMAGFRRVLLVVPRDMRAMCIRACGGEVRLADKLARLVLSHELAHGLSWDVLALPGIQFHSLLMGGTALILSCVSVLLLLFPDTLLVGIVWPALVMCALSAVFAFSVGRRFIHARERLADAVSLLALPPNDITALVSGTAQGPSPLAAFLCQATIPAASRIDAGFSITSVPFASDAARMQDLGMEVAQRSSALEHRVFLLPLSPRYLLAGAILASLLAAITYQAVSETFHLIVLSCDIPCRKEHFIVVQQEWSNNRSMISAVFWALPPLLAAMAACFTLILPLRDSFFEDFRNKRSRMAWVCGSIIVCAILSTFCTGLVDKLTSLRHYPTNGICVTSLPLLPVIVLTGTMMLCAVALKWSKLLKLPRFTGRTTVSMILSALIVSLVTGFFLSPLSLTSRLLLLMIAVGLSVVTAALIPFFAARDSYQPSEWLLSIRILRWWHHKVDHPSCMESRVLSPVLSGAYLGAIRWAIPASIIALAAHPLLVAFDNWHQTHEGILHDKAAQMVKALDAGRALGFMELIICQTSSWITLITGHATVSGAEALLWLIFTAFLVFLIARLIIELICQYSSDLSRVSYTPTVMRISRLLGISLLPDNGLKHYTGTLLQSITSREPYVHSPGLPPQMKATCETLALSGWPATDARLSASMAWIRRCAAPAGGFGCAPGEPADPLHTAAGLNLFSQFSLLDKAGADLHLAWLEIQIRNMTTRASTFAPSCYLSKMVLLLESHHLLSSGTLHPRDIARIHMDVLHQWRTGDRSIQETRDAFIIMRHLGIDTALFSDHLKSDWLPMAEFLAVRLDPKTRTGEILCMVEIESFLNPADFRSHPSVAQLAKSLSTTYAPGRR